MPEPVSYYLHCPHCNRTIRFHQAFFYLDRVEIAGYCTACDGKTVVLTKTYEEILDECRRAALEGQGPPGGKPETIH